jgi:hypothetical protein
MKLGVLLGLSIMVSFVFAKDNGINESKSDSDIKEIFAEYQKALIAHDANFPEKWFISEREYKQLIDLVRQKQPNCVGTDEESFNAESNSKVYKDLISSKAVISKISVIRIDYNNSCGNVLEISRVSCLVQYGAKNVVEVPFLLVKTLDNQYKILKNFLNYKLLSNNE